MGALLSSEHFSVAGTLIEAWAAMKSFKTRDGGGDDRPGGGRNADRHANGETRRDDMRAWATDPDARPYRESPGRGDEPYFMGHRLMENRHGLVVDTDSDPSHRLGRARRRHLQLSPSTQLPGATP